LSVICPLPSSPQPRSFTPLPPPTSSPLFPYTTLFRSLMPALPPHEVVSLLGRRLERLRTTREGVDKMLQTARAAGMPHLFTIEHDYELAVLTVEEEFVERLLMELANAEFNGLQIWERSYELRKSGRSEK